MKNTSLIRQTIATSVAALKRPLLLLPALLCLSTLTARGADSKAADYVFKNGAVYTMDAAAPKAQAVAVTGKEISYVGDDKGAEAYVGEDTKVIDLKGKMLMPGFVEAHIHPGLAMFAQGADLQCESLEEILARVKAWADANPDATVIRGFGWRYFLFPKTGPTKADLDKLFPDRPVMLVAIDVHSAWVNSKALEMAGINAETPDPIPGVSYFERDPVTKEPTGWVVETAAEQAILAKLDPPSPDAVRAATAKQLTKFADVGITAAWDAGLGAMPDEVSFEGYQRLEKENKLPIRIVGVYYWNTPKVADPVPQVLALRKKFNSELVQVRALKIMLDGGESQHTAVMLKPYADQPDSRGEFQISPEVFTAAVLKAQENGLDTCAHSYGDGATQAYLDAVEAAHKAYPDSPSRHTAAHAMFLTDEQIARFPKLDVTMQTSAQWFTPDPTFALILKYVGEDVVFSEYARMNSMLKAGGRLAMGSDWPASGWVATYRPLDAVQVAMTRAILPQYGKQKVMPIVPTESERITLDQALKAYTLDAAYVLGLEDKIGSLKPGKLADLVVLDKDLHKIPASDISATKVDLTMMNGKITHQAL